MAIKCFGEEELRNLTEVILSQDLWRAGSSDFVSRFEEAFGRHLGRKYVLAVNSGTSANESAYAGLGLEPGDEIICPAMAPIFVSFPVVAVGCVPVFADVDPKTNSIDPDAIEKNITARTRAVVVVHLNGQPAQMDEIMSVAKKHNLKVVEDCAQAFDAFYKGRKVGTIGDITCFSLQQSKHITSGEGGMIATDDAELYKRATEYSNCGMPWYLYDMERPEAEPVNGLPTRGHFHFGHNYRMGELQGAVALAQLEKIDEFNERRRQFVEYIETELGKIAGIRLAYSYPDTVPNYWDYPFWGPEEVFGLGCEINYLEVAYQDMQKKRQTSLGVPLPDYVQYVPGLCPHAEASAKGASGVACHHSLDMDDVRKEIAEIKAKL